MKIISLLLFCILIASCSKNLKKSAAINIIDIPKALNNQREIHLSEFVTGIEYIPLEVTDQSILFGPLIEVTDEYIIARNSGQSALGPILLFERETGKFLRLIGKSGRGPNEFQMGNLVIYNIYNSSIYGKGYNKDIKEYSIDGHFIGSFKLPFIIDDKVPEKFGTPSVNLDQYLSSDIFVAHIENSTGWEKSRIILFNRDSIIRVFPNHQFWEKKDWGSSVRLGLTIFFRFGDILSLKERFNDTIFQITTTSLIPRFVFSTGNRSPSLELQEINGIDLQSRSNELNKYIMINSISESSKYIFFNFTFNKINYTGIYNKITGEDEICKLTKNNVSGFVDDINNFLPVKPLKITENNELIYRLDPERIKQFVFENPNWGKSLKKNMDWVKSISLTSNPVILIAKLKD